MVVRNTTLSINFLRVSAGGNCFMESLGFRKVKDIDIGGLLEEVNEEHWKEVTLRQDHPESSHKDTESIYLRWSEKMDVKSVFNDLMAVDYPALDRLPVFKDILGEIFHSVRGEKLGRAMLVKLKGEGFIDRHVDEGPYADYYDRFHLCLQSGENVNFMIDHTSFKHYECCNMQPGELWWFDHKKPHCVDNTNSVDRIHLIVDIKTSMFRGDGF